METLANNFYYFYTNVWDGCYDEYIDEDDIVEEGEYETKTKIPVNENHFFRGYFFFNDMVEEPDADEDCDALSFNTMEHLDIYWSNNDSGGHYDCLKIEHWVDGDLKEHFNPGEFEQLR